MKVIPFKVPCLPNESFRLQIDKGRLFPHLHEHREVQISWIRQGSGTLIAGNYCGSFAAGDVFIIGSHQPHVFRADNLVLSEADEPNMLSVYFSCDACATGFWQLQELADCSGFITESRHSYALCGEARSLFIQHLHVLASAEGIDRVMSFLQMLKCLQSLQGGIRQLSSAGLRTHSATGDCRLERVIKFTEQHYARTIKISEVAALTHLTETSFCKYFKSRTGKTYVDYLNEIRVARAAEHLLDDTRTISCVCYESGFASLSNFNRSFKRINQVTPKEWRLERRRLLL